MNHGGHEGHDMPRPMSCSMNMLWNSQVTGTCVVFESWHISTWWGMVVSCVLIALVSFSYSLLLARIKTSDRRTAVRLYLNSSTAGSATSASNAGLHPGGSGTTRLEAGRESPSGRNVGITKLPTSIRLTRATTYALSVTTSFFLMLVAMTYNTYLFGSIVVGAFLGHLWCEDEMDVGAILQGAGGKGLACH